VHALGEGEPGNHVRLASSLRHHPAPPLTDCPAALPPLRAGFLSPANRGGLMTAMLLLFVFMGAFAGYSSARLYKHFKGENWKRTTVRTALTFPGVVSAIFLTLNFLVWGQKSSGAFRLRSRCAGLGWLGRRRLCPDAGRQGGGLPFQLPNLV
jgi:hypothetical protein